MKLKLYVVLALLWISLSKNAAAQTVDDVLEKGIMLNNESIILLKVDTDGTLLYQVWPQQKNKYRPLSEASLFMSTLDYAHVYMRPINPLNLSQKTDLVFTVDAIEKAATEAIESILKSVQQNMKSGDFIARVNNIEKAGKNTNKKGEEKKEEDTCKDFTLLLSNMMDLQAGLKNDKKGDIGSLFEKLKKITFASESATIAELKETDDAIKLIADYYIDLAEALKNFNKNIEELSCGDERNVFINKFVFKNLSDEMLKVFNAQNTRLSNLKNAYKAVKSVQEEASVENEGGLKWVTKLKPIEIKRGEISEFTLAINETGYSLSPEKEIVKLELKEKSRRTLKFRQFQRFVPEVLAGTAYTNLDFPEFSTTTDKSGEEVVVKAGSQNVRRLNITTMVNLNYYVRNSNVHPFIQLGAGANVGYPTLLLGTGLRFKFQGLPAFTLAVGGASSWVQELKTLKPGDKVSGPADIENDKTYTFKSPKLYYGIQIHF